MQGWGKGGPGFLGHKLVLPPPDWGSSFPELLLALPPCQGISPEGDADSDGGLDLEEFILYLQEREQRLLLLFHSLDRNQDGEAKGWGCGGPGDANRVRAGSARRREGRFSLMTHTLFWELSSTPARWFGAQPAYPISFSFWGGMLLFISLISCGTKIPPYGSWIPYETETPPSLFLGVQYCLSTPCGIRTPIIIPGVNPSFIHQTEDPPQYGPVLPL